LILDISNKNNKIADLQKGTIRKTRKIFSDKTFSPNMIILSRILRVLFEKNSMGKTRLSLEAKVNYVRLIRYLDWLEKKNIIEFVIKDGKINIILSHFGTDVATTLSLLS
jgi:predicted transcriptional regulator